MRKSEAIWNEKQQRWLIKVQADGIRKTFADPTPGKRGKVSAERKADDWLEHRTVGTTTRCEVLLDKYAEQKKSTTGSANYKLIEYHIRIYIKPVIGTKKISHITEADLQEVINRAFAAGLSKKTLTSIRATLTGFMKYCRMAKATTLFPENITIPKAAKNMRSTLPAQMISGYCFPPNTRFTRARSCLTDMSTLIVSPCSPACARGSSLA